MKKLYVLSVFLTFAVFRMTAQVFVVDNFKFKVLNDNTVSVAKADGISLSGDLVIPATVDYEGNSYDVSQIAWHGFKGCSSLESIIIPSSVTSISDGAFQDCSSLASVSIPSGVTNIGHSAFRGCSSLASISIPSGVTTIGHSAFRGCSSLASISIPSGVTTINVYAFYGCTNLTSVNIPSNVNNIGENAFGDCNSLETIECLAFLPADISSNTFSSDVYTTATLYVPTGAKDIYQEAEGWKDFATIVEKEMEGVVCDFFDYTVTGENCVSVKAKTKYLTGDIVIPSETTKDGKVYQVTSISINGFSGCNRLTSVIIPESVSSIGASAFYRCSSLTSVSIPSGVTTINYNTFYGCTNLTSVNIPSSVINIGENAFGDCNSLETIECLAFLPADISPNTFSSDVYTTATLYVPTGAKDIYQEAEGWKDFATIVEKEMEGVDREFFEYTVMDENSVSVKAKNKKLIGEIVIPSETTIDGKVYQVTRIDIQGFSGCNRLTGVIIPESVTYIGIRAFQDCNSLASISIPSGVTYIYNHAFYGCTNLTNVNILSDVNCIGENAFGDCNALKTIECVAFFPAEISSNTFSSDVYTTATLNVPTGAKAMYQETEGWKRFATIVEKEMEGVDKEFFEYTVMYENFVSVKAKTKNLMGVIVIPSETTIEGKVYQVTRIGSYGFSGCNRLTGVVIPESVNIIDNRAFLNCSSLASISIPSGMTYIGSGAFQGCSSLASISIPSGVTFINANSFYGCTNLTSVNISSDVNSIGENAFGDCNALKTIECVAFFPADISFNTFSSNVCTTATLYVPTGAKAMYQESEGWKDFATIVEKEMEGVDREFFEYTVTDYNFVSVKAKTKKLMGEIVIPSETTIDGKVYQVTSIIIYGFSGCNRLIGVIIPESVSSIGNKAFQGCSSLASISIPLGVTDIGASAFSGCSSLTSISIPSGVRSIGENAFGDCNALKTIECLEFFPADISSNTFSSDVCTTATLYVPTGAKALYQESEGWKDFATIVEKEMEGVDRELFEYTVTDENSVSVKAKTKNLMGDIVIPSETTIDGKVYQVTSVAYGGFQECKKITSIVLPNTIELIDWWSFSDCTSLKSITLPESLTEICSWAFFDCSSLERLDIPKNVNSFGWGVLSGDCNQLKEITVASENTSLKVENGLLMNMEGTIAVAYAFGRESEHLVIPETVKSLNQCALFHGNKRLKTIKVPAGVTLIGLLTFEGCTSLEEVMLPDEIKAIKNSAFRNCTSLRRVTIPASLNEVSSDNFSGCTAIKTVNVRQNSPLEIQQSFFPSEVYANATLYVPKGRKTYFADAIGWKNFHKIEEVDIDGVEISTSPYENIKDNQMVFGYYRSGKCLSADDGGYGGPHAGIYKICVGFTEEQLEPFVGNEITNIRFALVNTDVQGMKVWIGATRDRKDLLVQNVGELKTGWNEVVLDTPYQITGDAFYMGIEYEQDGKNYPMSAVSDGKEMGSSYFYGPYNGEDDYRWIESDDESVSIQCIVEGDQLPLYDVRAVSLAADGKYYKEGETVSGYFYLRNWGKKTVEDYDLTVCLDWIEVGTYHIMQPLSGSFAFSNSFSFSLDGTLSSGKHNLTAFVSAINGETPKFANDDSKTAKLNVYVHSMERQKVLLDHFTATWCQYCPSTDRSIENLMSERDDIALVSSHASDRMSCKAGDEYLIFTEYLPSTFLNRYAPIGATSLDATSLSWFGINYAKELPAFADVNISSSYDKATRRLNIVVRGTKNEEFDVVEEYTCLTVLLTEDDVVYAQYDGELEQTIIDYRHQGVLRTNVSAIWGDPIVWDGDHYSKTYTVVLDTDWNPDNMNIVAYLAKPFNGSNYDEIGVVNCNSERIDFDAVFNEIAISSIDNAKATVLKSYDTSGRQVNKNAKGLHIIKMSDGTTRKVVVK